MSEALKEELLAIAANEYTVPMDVDAYPYAQWMLDHIGSTDSTLRDTLIYGTLAQWISRGVFRPKELRGLLLQSLSYMFVGIGEKGTDTVFTRAFSVLLVPLILRVHEKEAFLSEEQLYSVAEEVLSYVQSEQDTRGYVEEKGWAHAIAHGADALEAMARVIQDRTVARGIVTVVAEKIKGADMVYLYEEEKRLAQAVLAVRMQQLLTEPEWESWLISFTDLIARPGFGHAVAIHNTRYFLQSLYWQAKEQDASFAAAIAATLPHILL